MLEALAFFAAEQRIGRRAHVIELERVFAHAAIAKHLDLATAHSLGGEWIARRAARLGHEQHGKTRISFGIRQRPRKQRHHVGAARMGDQFLASSITHSPLDSRLAASRGRIRCPVR